MKNLVYYYLLKRLFVFADEWLFYVMLYKLYRNKYYKIWWLVLVYGSGCLYTSYANISKIEMHIFNEEQNFYIVTRASIEDLIESLTTTIGGLCLLA